MNQAAIGTINPVRNKSLSTLSTLGIGGDAKYYVEVNTLESLQSAFLFAKQERIPFFILGKGSNCLFDDLGFNGLVIHMKIDFLHREGNGIYDVGAGYSFSRLGTQTAKEGYSGLEFASGIPASVGGAVFMNAGANGFETKDFLLSVDFLDVSGTLKTYQKEELSFSYRTSPFQEMKGAIVSARFSLIKKESAREDQIKIIQYRQKTQPYGEKSAGCVFRNPPGTPAGQLIDQCGLKGYSFGEASVSDLHANFLINKGSSSSKEFKALIDQVRKKVKAASGIELESEVRVIPYELKD